MPSRAIGEVGTQLDVLGVRIVAAIVDTIVAGVVAGGLGVLLASGLTVALEPDPDGFIFVVSIVTLPGYFGYFVLLEGAYSRTVGKRLVGIVVTRRDGTAISWKASLVRNALRLVDGWFYNGVGLFAIVFSEEEQRIGDVVARTYVVRARD